MRTAQDFAGPVSVSPTEGASRVPRRFMLINESALQKKNEYANFNLGNMCDDTWQFRSPFENTKRSAVDERCPKLRVQTGLPSTNLTIIPLTKRSFFDVRNVTSAPIAFGFDVRPRKLLARRLRS